MQAFNGLKNRIAVTVLSGWLCQDVDDALSLEEDVVSEDGVYVKWLG